MPITLMTNEDKVVIEQNIAQLAAEVETLKENNNEPTSIEVDATLTQEGMAADAAAVGSKITELSEEIAELKGEGKAEPVTYIADIPGYWNINMGQIYQVNYSFHTDYIPLAGYKRIDAQYKIVPEAYALAFFDEEKNILPSISVKSEGTDKYYTISMDVPDGAAYCMLSDYKYGGTQGGGSITLSGESANKNAGLTSAQITALDNMFKVCAYVASADSAYAAFRAAFGITDGVNVYFADYSEWSKWGAGISVVDNGFAVNSPEKNYNAGIAVGILQAGKYGDYKNVTLKISCDVAGELSSDAQIPFYLRTYTDIPEASYTDKATAFIRGPVARTAQHVEWTVTPSTVTWEGGTPNDTDYFGLQFYFYFVGEATITNFSIEVV